MKSFLVAGGGIAGIAAASFLAERGHRVTLIESSPKFGGRAYSLPVPDWGAELDNGQHLLMGCYKQTLSFLKLIGAADTVSVRRELLVPFIAPGGVRYLLAAAGMPYPFNLLAAVLRFSAVTPTGRLKIIKLFARLPFLRASSLRGSTVGEWLIAEKQSRDAIENFWEVICVGTMNTGTETASASMFLRVCKTVFLGGNAAASFVVPSVPLSKMYVEPALRYITASGGSYRAGNTLASLTFSKGSLQSAELADGSVISPDGVIVAVAPWSLPRIIGAEQLFTGGIPEFTYNPIVTLHIKVNNNPLRFPLYACLNSPVQWVFNHGRYITTVTSHAAALIRHTSQELKEILLTELFRLNVITKANVAEVKVIKEKRATFVPLPVTESGIRPAEKTSVPNVVLCGDYCNTGFPATLESAVLSARRAVTTLLANTRN